MPGVRLPHPHKDDARPSQGSRHGLSLPSLVVGSATATSVRLLPGRSEVTLSNAELVISGWAPIPLPQLLVVFC